MPQREAQQEYQNTHTTGVCGAQSNAEDSRSAETQLTTAKNGQTDGAEAVVKGSKGTNNYVKENTCSTTTSRWTGFTFPVIVGVVWKNKCAGIDGKKQVAGVGMPFTECASTAVTEEFQETLDAGTTNKKTKKRRRNRKRKNKKCKEAALKSDTAEEPHLGEEITSVTVEDLPVTEHIKSSTEALPSMSEEITFITEEVMPVSEEVQCDSTKVL